MNAVAIGNFMYGRTSSVDWDSLISNLSAVAEYWKLNELDQKTAPYLNRVRSNDLYSANLDLTTLHSHVKAFHASAQIEDLAMLLTPLNTAPDAVKEELLLELRMNGFVPTIERAIEEYKRLAVLSYPSSVKDAAYRVSFHGRPHLLEVDCAGVNLVIMAAGLAFLTIGVMASGGVFLLAGWGAIAAWGGGAATVADTVASIGGC